MQGVLTILAAIISLSDGLRFRPPLRALRSPQAHVNKRQDSATSTAASVTTIYSLSGTLFPAPSSCVCRLISAFTPYVTTTSSYTVTGSDSGTITTTLNQPAFPTPGTVEVIEPLYYLTITQTYTATDSNDAVTTTTIASPAGSLPGTVEVLSPVSYVTLTATYTATDQNNGLTTTTIALPSGSVPGTVEVFTPVSYITVTATYTATDSNEGPLTTTLATPIDSTPGTVEILTPVSYVTLTSTYTAADSNDGLTTTTIAYPLGSTAGTVEVLTPVSYTTFTSTYTVTDSNSAVTTTTLAQPDGSTPGTVEILTPVSFVTVTSFYTETDMGETIATTTIAQPSGSVPGTVVIEYPESYIITTESSALAFATSTTTLADPSGTSPGQIEVLAPTDVATCGNRGIKYALFDNPYYNNAPAGPGYPNYPTTSFESQPALYRGITTYMGYTTPNVNGNVTIYTDTTQMFPAHNFTNIHYAFLFARLAGTYTWTSSYANDITLLWVGDTAITCSERGTALIDQTYAASESPQSYSADFTAGQYVPFKVQHGQSLGSSQLNMIIQGPDGRQLLNRTGSQDIVYEACDTVLPSFTTCAGYVTTTSVVASFSSTETSTLTDPSGTASGTIEVIVPSQTGYTTITTMYTGTDTRTAAVTSTVSSPGANQGEVVIEQPNYAVTTVTSGTTGATFVVQTATGTSSGTVEVAIPTPDLSCGNHGFEYAIFSNPYTRGLQSADPTYSEFQAEAFKTDAPQATGITNYLGLPFVERGTEAPIYDQPPQYWNLEAVNHRAYLFAKLSGNFTFDFPLSDDITLLWVGDNVYGPTYTRANADLEQLYNGGIPISEQTRYTYNVTLEQGEYVPVRVLYANAEYDADFEFNIFAPDGELITNSSTQFVFSPYVVRFSCDGTTAPMYVPWGQEG